MQSLYQRFMNTRTTPEYVQELDTCPAVSRALLEYLDRLFTAPVLMPGTPDMAQHLIYQHGIEAVKNHLKALNEKQEAEVKREFTRD